MQRIDKEINISNLHYDVLEPIFSYLKLKDTLSLLGTCHSLYSNAEIHKKNIRKAYIKEFLTEQPELITKYADQDAFNALWQDFISPFEKDFFKISNPIGLKSTTPFTHGKFRELLPKDVCLTLGFEKLYLQLYRSYQWHCYAQYRADNDFDETINRALCKILCFDRPQIDCVQKSKYSAAMLWAMVNDVEPFLYFTALGATLINGRVDIFDALFKEFEVKKQLLINRCDLFMQDGKLNIGHNGNGRKLYHEADLNLQNIKQWSPQFKCEYDRMTIPSYAERACCEAIFELCLAKNNEPNLNNPLHFLWACYTGDTSCLLKYLKNPAILIETVYSPEGYSESAYSIQYRRQHPKVENMKECAISLYARNAHEEDINIIAILLNNPAICDRIHMRDAYQRTPLLIALEHDKLQLVEAMLAKTSKEILELTYSDKERQKISNMMKAYHASVLNIAESPTPPLRLT
jgi:hypothetical protein